MFLKFFILFMNSIVIIKGQNQFYFNLVPSLPISPLNSDNELCNAESELYVKSVENLTYWASEMWDATAKTATGTLRGNTFNMGHFDQCLTTDAPFDTQYCLVAIEINVPKPDKAISDPLSLYRDPYDSVLQKLYFYNDVSQKARNMVQMAWCLPASCQPIDMENYLNEYFNKLNNSLTILNINYSVSVSEMVCNKQNEKNIVNAPNIMFCFLTLVLILLTVSSSLYDIFVVGKTEEKPPQKSLCNKLFLAFSAKKNFNYLRKIEGSHNPALSVLYGMRTLCICLIIMDHRFGTLTASALLNFNYVEEKYRAPGTCFLFRGDLIVDTFFFISGLLVAYGLLSQLEKKSINPGLIILWRYIRLTPVYAFVVFYYATLFDYSGSGPLWKLIAGQDSEDCKTNWWTNLLYLSNYINAEHMCMTHSWYLPCDFHYFIIGIFVCMLIQKNLKLGLGSLLFLIIASCVIPFVLTFIYNRPAILLFYPEFLSGPKTHPDFLLRYSKSHTRATPYFIGMFAGYIYYKLKESNKHVCRSRSVGILSISAVLILISVLCGVIFYNPYHTYNALESASFAALNRLAFSIGTFGFIYIASYGHAKVIKDILSWKPWVPLSQLTYGAYLIHMQFQLRAASESRNPRNFNFFDIISLSLSDMVLAFLVAFCLYLCIEAPFKNIFKYLLYPSVPPKEKPQKEITMEPAIRENMINNNTTNIVDSRL